MCIANLIALALLEIEMVESKIVAPALEEGRIFGEAVHLHLIELASLATGGNAALEHRVYVASLRLRIRYQLNLDIVMPKHQRGNGPLIEMLGTDAIGLEVPVADAHANAVNWIHLEIVAPLPKQILVVVGEPEEPHIRLILGGVTALDSAVLLDKRLRLIRIDVVVLMAQLQSRNGASAQALAIERVRLKVPRADAVLLPHGTARSHAYVVHPLAQLVGVVGQPEELDSLATLPTTALHNADALRAQLVCFDLGWVLVNLVAGWSIEIERRHRKRHWALLAKDVRLKVRGAETPLSTSNHRNLQIVRPLCQRGAIELGKPIQLDVVQGAHLAAVGQTAAWHPGGFGNASITSFSLHAEMRGAALVQHLLLGILKEVLYVGGKIERGYGPRPHSFAYAVGLEV